MSSQRFQGLSDEQLQSVDAICADFEQALKAGEPTSIEDCLSAAAADLQSYLFTELLATELEYQSAEQHHFDIGDYERRFPGDVESVHRVFRDVTTNSGDMATLIVGEDDTASVPPSRPNLDETLDSGAIRATDLGDMPEQFGRYRLKRMLGRGGMGAVFLAHDSQLDRQVALKVPRFGEKADRSSSAIKRFYREARSMATVHHPNLCPVYDVGEIEGTHFLTMAYIEGRSLWHRLATGEKVPPAEAVSLVLTLAQALQVAHEAGIVHRDLKPSNVMMGRQGEPIIMDFGLAHRSRPDEAELTHSGAIVGSPAYMSPEQVEADHEQIGPATDIYALGVMLYQMLCGRRPFEGSTASVLGQIVSEKKPPRPSELSDADPMLEAICLKAMSHDIADRYQTAPELVEVLREYQLTDPAARRERATRFSRTSLAVTASAAVLVTVGIASVLMNRGDIRRPERVQTPPTPAQWEMDAAPDVFPDTSHLLPPVYHPSRPSTGRFIDSGQRLGKASAHSVAAGDLDSDGDVDVVVANYANGPSQVWLNDGNGHFSPGQYLASKLSADVRLGDLNDDGHLDVVFALRSETTPITIWLNDGQANFDETGQNVQTGLAKSVALADVDGDGDLDFAMAAEFGANQVWFNNGSGTFEDSGQRLGGSKTFYVALGDLDGDSAPDLVEGNFGESDRVWLNDGNGHFVVTDQPLGHYDCVKLTLADIEADGDLDIYVGNVHEPSSLWINDGSAHFMETQPSGAILPSIGVSIADLNGDGNNDALLANGGHHLRFHIANRILLAHDNNDGWDKTWIGDSATAAFAIADFDRDGDLDIYLANGVSQPDRVWLNQDEPEPAVEAKVTSVDELLPGQPTPTTASAGTFVDSGQALGNSLSVNVDAGDVDRDGDIDVLVANTNTEEGPLVNVLYLNDGHGQFEVGQQLPSIPTDDVALGDLDGDGDLDAVFAHRSSHPANTIWWNDGTGRFVHHGDILGPQRATSVALHDLDGDHDLDVILAGNAANHVYRNDSGTFSLCHQSEGSTTLGITTADLDGDGDMDFVEANWNGADQIWLNDGDGVFSPGMSFGSGNSIHVAAADVDHDGDVDVVITKHAVPAELWLNDGAAGLTLRPLTDEVIAAVGVAIGDLNGDGRNDVFIGNGGVQSAPTLRPNQILLAEGDSLEWKSTTVGSQVTTDIAFGDFDGDGDLDAFLTNASYQPNRVWINKASDD